MKSIFIETNIDTQTVYHENGSFTVTPAVYEDGRHQVVAEGKNLLLPSSSVMSLPF